MEEAEGVVLLNIAHTHRTPRCDVAAVRVLGIFPTVDNARKHAQAYPCDCTVRAVPVRRWCLLAIREDTDEMVKLQRIGEAHRKMLRRHEEDFWENTSSHSTGMVTERLAPEDRDNSVSAIAGEDSPAALSRAAEVRNQQFAVVSIIDDYTTCDRHEKEPAFIVWSAHSTEDECKEAVKTKIAHSASDVHLDVVCMYEWLLPANLDLSKVTEEFRDEQLTQLMQHRKTEQQRVQDFRAQCNQGDVPAPCIDLGLPGSLNPESITYPTMQVSEAPAVGGDSEDIIHSA